MMVDFNKKLTNCKSVDDGLDFSMEEADEIFSSTQGDPDDSIGEALDIHSLDFDDSESSPLAGPTCSFLTGSAGTGKTFLTRARIAKADEDSRTVGSIKLAASTGVAAVNLGAGVSTIHSMLRFYDEASLQDAFLSGRLQRTLVELQKAGVREIVIDEVSMLSAGMLDLIYKANREVADYSDGEGGRLDPIALTLVGDFCQLPPVKAKYAFEADCWPEFEKNITRLTKIWRQNDGRFLDCLNHLRRGEGKPAADLLVDLGVIFHQSVVDDFPATTIRPTNEMADRFNELELSKLEGKLFGMRSTRWGTSDIYQQDTNGTPLKQPGDWKNIPVVRSLKIGARLMILSNDTPAFTYVNGDTGVLKGLVSMGKDWETGKQIPGLVITLDRNGEDVTIGKITRDVTMPRLPEEWKGREAKDRVEAAKTGRPYYKCINPGASKPKYKWCFGEVDYYPIRLAWSSTVHKTQGLSMNRVQIDMTNRFFGEPGMAYVALSRCRTPEGLRLVGTPELLAKRCSVDPRVRGWL